jgi:tetratricopeptide (TPR) repeat protein
MSNIAQLEPLRMTQISVYNPGRLSDEEIERIFVARIKLFELLFQQIVAEQPNSIPQHLLLIGERGMGKSMLLNRLAVELRKAPHHTQFIPLTFPEEQYDVDRLSKFWLNCLDALADALERIQHPDVAALDADIARWSKDTQDVRQMYDHFKAWSQRVGRRPVLLVDNLSLIFSRINKEEQHQLRAFLMENGTPILVGATATSIEEVSDYGAPFYDFLKQYTLKKLNFEEAIETLLNLGKLTQNQPFINEIQAKRPRIQALYQLTGGTPRTLTMLFPLVQNGFSDSIQTDLEALMDSSTALYKARFEELSDQMQLILDAVALHWDPVTLETLREITRLDNAQLSSPLKRLYDTGWLHRMEAYQSKSYAYEISERFFNIWYLMRRSSRRQKRELLCLTKFLGVFYGEDLPGAAKTLLTQRPQHPDHVGLHLAMADAVGDKRLANKLRSNAYGTLLDWGLQDEAVLKNFDIPKEFISKKEEGHFKKAQEHLKNKAYAEAAQELEYMVKLNKERVETWFMLGNLYRSQLHRYEAAEAAYHTAIKLDGSNAGYWKELGNLYMLGMNKYEESEQAYLNAIELDENYAHPWNNLAILYKNHNRFNEAEYAYKKAIELDENYAHPWNNLGNLYRDYLNRYAEAEYAYKKAIQLDENFASARNNLGNLYQYKLNRYAEAEAAYQKAIQLDENFAYPWNVLGNLYQDHLRRYEEAEQAYLKSIELDELYAPPKHNLIFLYRDKMNRLAEAKVLFEVLKPKDGFMDSYHLHATLFALYDQNLGIAAEHLEKALSYTDGRLPHYTQDDWWRFAAVAHRLGYGKVVLDTFARTGYDIQLRPYYEALKALGEKDPTAYLNSVAVEVREPAGMILEWIRRYI